MSRASGSSLTSPALSAVFGAMGKRSPHEAVCPRIASGFPRRTQYAAVDPIPSDIVRLTGSPACPVRVALDTAFMTRRERGGRRRSLTLIVRQRLIPVCKSGDLINDAPADDIGRLRSSN
jgi:hypothetical protein